MVSSYLNGTTVNSMKQTVSDESIALEKAPSQSEPTLSLSWIESELSRGRMKFSKFWRKCQTSDEFVKGEFDFPITEDGTQIRLGTAHSTVKTLTDHITPPFIDITVPPPGPRGQARAERIEKFLRGANHRLEQDTPTRRTINFHMASYGVAWEKTEFAGNRWAEFPEPPDDSGDVNRYKEDLDAVMEKRAISWPVVAKAVNPQQCVWDTNNQFNPRWVMHFWDVEATWIHAHFPGWEGPNDGNVQFIEIWTQSQVAYIAEQAWVMKPRKHGYMTLPWTMYWPQTGLVTLGNKPEDLYRGILDGNFDMIRAESQLASHYLDIVNKSAWPVTNFQGPPGMTEEVQAEYDQAPGSRNNLPPQVTVDVQKVPDPPQSILIAKGVLDEALESNTAPSVTRGQRPSGSASGYETAVLSGISRLNFAAYVDGSQRGLQHRNEIILNIVQYVIRDRITVWGQTESGSIDATISPKDIKGHVVNFVQLNPTAPEERERTLNLWSTKWREGFVDHDTALREAGVSNAHEVQAKLLAEKFMQSEQIQGLLEGMAAARVPLIQNIVEAAGATNNEAADIATNILNTQGATQLPNAGNFQQGNQAGTRPQTPGTGAPTTTRPVMPGSIGEADLTARQISSPARDGSRRVPTSQLPAGLGR